MGWDGLGFLLGNGMVFLIRGLVGNGCKDSVLGVGGVGMAVRLVGLDFFLVGVE